MNINYILCIFSGNVTFKLTYLHGDNLAQDPSVGMPTLSLGVGGLRVLEGVLALSWAGTPWSSRGLGVPSSLTMHPV